ncbi:MAG: MBL fold metallo-hydrolase [Legionella sp.]|nr:MBL fold metallo-hydrolase [Legionella sp.]
MLTNAQLILAIQNLNLLIKNVHSSASQFTIVNNKISKNLFLKSKLQNNLGEYLQGLINEVGDDDIDYENPLITTLFVSLQYFFHLEPNNLIKELNLDFERAPSLERNPMNLNKFQHTNQGNQFHQKIKEKSLPEIKYDLKTGHYTAPDDHKAHRHGEEAKRIFLATQLERFKAFIHFLFAKINIHVFETAPYKEQNYLESDIYSHHSAIQFPHPFKPQVASHYWIGHASSLITIPTDYSPLHVLTDPVEGDLAPLLYPRMTKEGSLIDGFGEKRLPKIDVVIISHNHRDHVSEATLKRLVKQQPKMIVPEGDEELFIRLGFTHVEGIKWWEQAAINDSHGNELLRVTAVPARHWSGRGISDAHRSAFNGYVLSSDNLEGDIYFAGDTALMEDHISQPILNQFNIITSIQPGGPDEGRKEMESTHQSSADALLMHFKILADRYQKLNKYGIEPTLDAFLEETKMIKTIYNHTATFKLGNLRLKDSFYSYQRIIAAFQNAPESPIDHLPKHEQKVIWDIRQIVKTMKFEGEQLTDALIANEILQGVVIPKIGQRQPLYFANKRREVNIFNPRNLITNGRALEEFDSLLQNYLSKSEEEFSPGEFIGALLEDYQQPWHAFFSRTYDGIRPYISEIRNCQDIESLLHVINRMEGDMGKRNPHGHMQSLVHYAKWIISHATQHPDDPRQEFKNYFICRKIRKLADQESHYKGGLFGNDRAEKQQAFQRLSDELADLPEELDSYQEVISNWLRAPTKNEQAVSDLLIKNRSLLFATSKTRSAGIVEQFYPAKNGIN